MPEIELPLIEGISPKLAAEMQQYRKTAEGFIFKYPAEAAS